MPKTINIPKELLTKLYFEKLLSSYQIAKKLGCSQNTVIERLKKFQIKTRTIQQGKALMKPKYRRVDFAGTEAEKAYLIGFRLGDLYVRKNHPDSPTIQVNSNSTKEEQIQLMLHLFRKYGHITVSKKDTRGATKVRCYLNKTFEFLLPKSAGIESGILGSKEASLAFLAGYIDAEGSFGLNNRAQPYFSLKSQDKEIMGAIHSDILPRLGVYARLHFVRAEGTIIGGVRSNRDVFGIFLYSKNDLKKLLTITPLFKHPKRVRDALLVLNRIQNVRT